MSVRHLHAVVIYQNQYRHRRRRCRSATREAKSPGPAPPLPLLITPPSPSASVRRFRELPEATGNQALDLIGAEGLVRARVVHPEQKAPRFRAARAAGQEDEPTCLRRVLS